MHEHDQEMIMALAEGTLTPTDAATAGAEIETCNECSRDLEMQRVALAALVDAPSVYLSATESARLHEALHRELKTAVPVPVRAQPRAAWGRVAGWAFGAAAVFLGAVLLLPALGGGGDDETADVVAIELPETTSAATAPTSAEFRVSQLVPEPAAESLDEAALSADGATAEAGAAEETAGLEIVAKGDLTEVTRTQIVDVLRLDLNAYRVSDAVAKTVEPRFAACLDQTMALGYSTVFAPPFGSEPQLAGLIIDDSGQERLLVVYIPANIDNTALAAITTDTCEVFQSVP